MQAFSYRGPGHPHEENLNYVVQTSAAADQSRGKLIVPSLPSGSLVTGLAAAALQHAEVAYQYKTHGMHCTVYLHMDVLHLPSYMWEIEPSAVFHHACCWPVCLQVLYAR